MKILGYIFVIGGLLLGGASVKPFSWTKYSQSDYSTSSSWYFGPWNKFNWYWKLLALIVGLVLCFVGIQWL